MTAELRMLIDVVVIPALIERICGPETEPQQALVMVDEGCAQALTPDTNACEIGNLAQAA